MLIKIPGWTLYSINQLARNEAGSQTLLCRDETRPGLFSVNIFTRSAINANYVSDYLNLLKEKTFPDFLDCRSKDSRLYVIFKYNAPAPINATLQTTTFDTNQRYKIIKNLLLWLISQKNIPPHFLTQLLREDNINLNVKGEIFFNYILAGPRQGNVVNAAFFSVAIAELTEKLFPLELNNVCQSAKSGKYPSIKDFYLAILSYEQAQTKNKAIASENALVLDLSSNLASQSLNTVYSVRETALFKKPINKALVISLAVLFFLSGLFMLNSRYSFINITSPTYYIKDIGTIHIGD